MAAKKLHQEKQVVIYDPKKDWLFSPPDPVGKGVVVRKGAKVRVIGGTREKCDKCGKTATCIIVFTEYYCADCIDEFFPVS